MFCRRCGEKLEDNVQFCPKCGSPVNQNPVGNRPELEPDLEQKHADRPQGTVKKKAKWPWILAVIVILAAVIIAGVLVMKKQKTKKQYQETVSNADKYLEDMDYEKAEDSYLEAIKLDPKEKETYIKLADLYMEQDEPNKAAQILKIGLKHVDKKDNAELSEKYSLYTYVDEELIPDIGQVKEGEYECSYLQVSEYGFAVDSVHSESGVLNWNIADYDNDGEEELLVLVMDNKSATTMDGGIGTDIDRNEIDLQMYELENGKVVKKDQYQGLVPVLGYGDSEDDGIFLQKTDNNIYICGSCSNHVYTYADGTIVKSFMLTYEDGKFKEQAGQVTETAGSSWEDDDGTAAMMADLAESIGLTKDADTIRKTHVPVFGFQDQPDKMLLRITGENSGYNVSVFYQQPNVENIGKVKLKLQLKFDTDKNEVTDEETVSADTYLSVYGATLDQEVGGTDAEFGIYNNYYFYDIDKDGVKEMILQTGTCEADYMYDIYTIENGTAKYIGQTNGGHTGFYEDENGGTEPYIVGLTAHMGYEIVFHLSINNGQIQIEVILNKELQEEDEYYNASAELPYADITNKSLLSQ